MAQVWKEILANKKLKKLYYYSTKRRGVNVGHHRDLFQLKRLAKKENQQVGDFFYFVGLVVYILEEVIVN